MKIWFDLSNSPHINLFVGMIRELKREHQVLITCRPLANTVDLLQLHRLPFEVVGRHYGAKTWKKAYGFPVRVAELVRYLRPHRIDVAVSQSSFHSPLVARLLGVRSIYMNDNEHALGNVPSFLCASTILIPEFLDRARLRWQGATAGKTLHYPGVKEGIYLWEFAQRLTPRAPTTGGTRPRIYVRPEPWTAQYYRGKVNFLDPLLLGLRAEADVTVLPRGADQARHYQGPQFSGVNVIVTALDLAEIAPHCDLFVGAGGTMTREMAVLGIPTISVYQDELLEVDRYLLSTGRMLHEPELTAARALDYLAQTNREAPATDLLIKGQSAYRMIKSLIERGTVPVAA